MIRRWGSAAVVVLTALAASTAMAQAVTHESTTSSTHRKTVKGQEQAQQGRLSEVEAEGTAQAGAAGQALEEEEPEPAPNPRLEVYGHAMTDMGYNFGTSDPDWFDTLRPTKLPAFPGEFGANGRWFMGVRQSRFGVKAELPTAIGELKTTFEFELFGVGDQAGETMFRLRHFYGELGPVLAGQTWSVFMDPDVFPNSIEYWGPNAMVFFRNVQVRWTPVKTDHLSVAVAAERPGTSQDLGQHQTLVEVQNVAIRYLVPDVTAHVRLTDEKWGHLQLAGIFRYAQWDDLAATPARDLSGHAFGWGLNLSGNLKFLGGQVLKVQVVYGHGIEAYMNDAGDDIGTRRNPGNTVTPVQGSSIPVFGVMAFQDIQWAKWLTSTIGYGLVLVDNRDGQLPEAFHRGQYALANVLAHPIEQLMFGPELQWAERGNFSDGFAYHAFRLQFSIKYAFERKFE